MHTFFVPNIIRNEILPLSAEESKHATRVLRLKPGSLVYIMDGKGTLAEATICEASKNTCSVQVEQILAQKSQNSNSVTIAVAPTKNTSRLEWFLEKSTEIGLAQVQLMQCSNSERKTTKPERLEKILLSAAKQSRQLHVPVLEDIQSFKTIIEQPFNGQRFIATCSGDRKHIMSALNSTENTLILIGPEGDFTPNEVSEAQKAGFTAISLGDSRLRVETAALLAVAAVNLNKDMHA